MTPAALAQPPAKRSMRHVTHTMHPSGVCAMEELPRAASPAERDGGGWGSVTFLVAFFLFANEVFEVVLLFDDVEEHLPHGRKLPLLVVVLYVFVLPLLLFFLVCDRRFSG
eukprot:CAMPEP_0167821312 /NCGR_PEP_ID=MMETSP0112_2-20121227/6708_1 /TAXON_ID=91324 /ORGANISM="Lotharella globosa, Strain CCCM811" /LENGTH=110 /DNA_ID=CAMNT_0007722229 /DNA_START=111 /DNA_END=444 /DNA_ORIENTATION=-